MPGRPLAQLNSISMHLGEIVGNGRRLPRIFLSRQHSSMVTFSNLQLLFMMLLQTLKSGTLVKCASFLNNCAAWRARRQQTVSTGLVSFYTSMDRQHPSLLSTDLCWCLEMLGNGLSVWTCSQSESVLAANMPRHSDYLLSHFMALENIHVLFYPFSHSGIYYFNNLTMAVQDMLILAKKTELRQY